MADIPPLDDLSTRQQNAVIALLSEPTIRKASLVCNVPERTLYAWLREDVTFKTLHARARRTAFEQALGQLQHHASDAVTVLVGLMKNAKVAPASRIIAAKTVLEMGQQWVTTEDMLRRIAALEQQHAPTDA